MRLVGTLVFELVLLVQKHVPNDLSIVLFCHWAGKLVFEQGQLLVQRRVRNGSSIVRNDRLVGKLEFELEQLLAQKSVPSDWNIFASFQL